MSDNSVLPGILDLQISWQYLHRGWNGHPYTEGLFGSLPDIEKRSEELKPIPGLMPDPTRLPEGCAFAPRCPHATDRCRQAPIPVVEVEPGHLVECVLFEQQGVAGA